MSSLSIRHHYVTRSTGDGGYETGYFFRDNVFPTYVYKGWKNSDVIFHEGLPYDNQEPRTVDEFRRYFLKGFAVRYWSPFTREQGKEG